LGREFGFIASHQGKESGLARRNAGHGFERDGRKGKRLPRVPGEASEETAGRNQQEELEAVGHEIDERNPD
jgi:hypothetical protein